ncbi:major facilitator superfamily domain-containing protein [Echria macrotheca]|uniref:Major facilitator superfamily domain-containing protein n=1 Tax=Echria macrotheca TaxID=438768 RepID=A0AAJ0B7U5_9PEZI|nr:major facilitator superfamily domain-containing protein [Echria macrotheca]
MSSRPPGSSFFTAATDNRPRSWLDTSRNLSRRFSSLEGWRTVGHGMYLVAGSTISTITPNPAYDAEWPYREGNPGESRLSKSDRDRLSTFTSPGWQNATRDSIPETEPNPFLSPEEAERARNPFEDYSAFEVEKPNRIPLSHQLLSPLPPSPPLERPFHIFTKRQKWVIIGIIGAAGLFSGLSSNIYFPSLDAIANDLHVSLNAVSLTITSYLIVQGISPLIWGSLSDTLGRRPIYIYSFLVYILANIVLSFSPNFPVLLVFRGIQAAGSASTVSIGNGVIQDIATPLERGAFISFYQAIRNFSIAVGPVIGGILANFFGFRSIFIFLFILSSIVVIAIAVFLPETLRTIAGNGTLRLTGIHQPLIRRFTKEPSYMEDPDDTAALPKVSLSTFLEPLRLVVEKDIFVSLVFGGMVYTVWSMVVASTTGLFKPLFGLSELTLGLVFIPNGLGTIIGSAIAGKLMTRDFLSHEQQYLRSYPSAPPPSENKKNIPLAFPIEHARLRQMPWITALFVLSTAAYGFALLPPAQSAVTTRPGWIVVPLVLQFLIAATSNAVFAINTTLVADLTPGKGASGAAVNNLVRCSMGAAGVGVVDSMIAFLGVGVTFLGLGLMVAALGVLVVVEWCWGMEWRGDRERRRVKVVEKRREEKA